MILSLRKDLTTSWKMQSLFGEGVYLTASAVFILYHKLKTTPHVNSSEEDA